MNDFTKEELEEIYSAVMDTCIAMIPDLPSKIQSMIDNYSEDPWNRKKIAQSHLREAECLISHALCLLDMKNE